MSLVDRLTDDLLEQQLAAQTRMVRDIATLRGMSVAAVEVAYGLPQHMHPCLHCAREWPSMLAAAECCDGVYPG